jgi:hypothetical protein
MASFSVAMMLMTWFKWYATEYSWGFIRALSLMLIPPDYQ